MKNDNVGDNRGEKIKETKYIAKIKVIQQSWYGWSPEGSNQKPKELIYNKTSHSNIFLLDQGKTGSFFNGDSNEVGNGEYIEYSTQEGYVIYVYNNQEVILAPKYVITPISGKNFPMGHSLGLKEERLKVGESIKIQTNWRDAGHTWTISVLEINEQK